VTTTHATQVLTADVLRDRTALVSGAGSGIGRACALRLVELGARVVGVGRHEETLAETKALAVDPERFEVAVCNVRDSEAMTAVVQDTGNRHGLDILVNNAGGQFFAPATGISDGGWASVIDLNLTAIFTATRAAYPFLAASRGAVVNMSLSGVERGGMGMAHSIAARSGVLGLTRSLALEWAPDGIRLNCLGPGTVVTSALGEEASEHVLGNLVQKATPMRLETSPEEVAELVAFVCSPAGRLMTGQLLQIDGGAHLGRGLHMLPEAYE
jgi:citronellol/citronellal dehydrogenase